MEWASLHYPSLSLITSDQYKVIGTISEPGGGMHSIDRIVVLQNIIPSD